VRERNLLDRILEPGELSVVFQPIFEMRADERKLHAVECLIRGPRGTNLESADLLLEYVRCKREENLVDRVCVETALAVARALPGAPRLCLNVHASTVGRGESFVQSLAETAQRNAIPLDRLTIEIVEHAPPWDEAGFLRAVGLLRELGVRIALDDIGLGQSNYKMILDTRPDYYKVDRYIVHGCHADFRRRAILESIAKLASRFEGQVVAEGVEQTADLQTVLGLGIDLMQGFLLSMAVPFAQMSSVPELCARPAVAN
jgi:EAL domain-containing protein (putative c-di-GMP-specific phosphodiesterase class I)